MRENRVMMTLQTWFGVSRRVDRATYAISGVVLMLVKYGVEAALFWFFASTILTPWQFVNPLLGAREAVLRPAPTWLPFLIYAWTLPFLWISVSMSIRRVADAGMSPWWGFAVLIPLVNLWLMLVFCVLPSWKEASWQRQARTAASKQDPLRAALSVGFSLIVGGMMVLTSV